MGPPGYYWGYEFCRFCCFRCGAERIKAFGIVEVCGSVDVCSEDEEQEIIVIWKNGFLSLFILSYFLGVELSCLNRIYNLVMRKRIKENHEIIFGPNAQGHVYKPAPYHGFKAKNLKDKTRWIGDANFEFSIFNIADVHTELPYLNNRDIIDKRWLNDDGQGLYAILNQGKNLLGQTGERLAFFPIPRNAQDPWHGYPTNSQYIGDELVEHWYSINVISIGIYRKLLKHIL